MDATSRRRVDTEALVVGYTMSRLGDAGLAALGFRTWRAAYGAAAEALSRPPTSFKNLRDEFDPFHANVRKGWRNRPLRQDRQRVLDELRGVSDEALLELVRRILKRDEEATAEAIDSLAVVTRRAQNVAERLLTGRLAEEYFVSHCEELVGVERANLVDMRLSALGFDFGVARVPERAIEVKGMKQERGDIQFTDREWSEANRRGQNYLLVVVGNLPADPVARVIVAPHTVLTAECRYQTSISAIWRARVAVRW